MPLTDTRLRALKPKDKPYKVTDERGLYVEVTPTGSKLWRFRYRIGGAQKKLCIGSYPDISLKQARDAAYEARRAVASGGDPAFEKRKRKIRAEFLSAQTFEAVAREYIEQMMVQNGRADGTIVKANYFLDKLAPAIGNRPIHEIEPFEVLAPLKRLEATGKHETAKKCRSFAGRVFRYGVATTRCKSDPTSMLKGALVTPRATHYAAILEPTELGGLLRAIDDFTGYMVTKLALQIAPHVFVRPGELRHAEWHEIDLVDGVWKIPAGKMKARRAHAVPLSKQVRGYLTDLADMLGREGYVFPSARSSKRPMSENTLNAAFRRMGYNLSSNEIIQQLHCLAGMLILGFPQSAEAWHKVSMDCLAAQQGIHRYPIMVRKRLKLLNANPPNRGSLRAARLAQSLPHAACRPCPSPRRNSSG
jgi:integrase